MRKSFSAVEVAKHCHGLLREVASKVESLKRVKTHLDIGLSNLRKVTLLGVGIVALDALQGLPPLLIL